LDWLYILALICVLLGLINGSMGLKSMRSKTYPQAEIAWNQPPLSPWRYETPSIVAISIHTLGLIGLTAFLLLSLAHHPVLTFPPKPNSDFLLFAISLFVVMFTSYISGVISAYHLVQLWIKPVSYGITREGMLYAGSLVGWQTFSHHEVGPDDGLISLYSSYSPGLRTWVLQPPPELFANVLEMIRRNLPTITIQTIDDPSAWQRSPLVMVIGMTFLVLGALLPAAWGWFQGQAWVWMYAFLAFLFVLFLGNKLIAVFDGRGNASVKPEAG
jgi:hypothetical protein